MHFQIVDSERIYRALLVAEDAAARERIFRAQIVAPFEGLMAMSGGGDGLEMFARWGMSPAQFAPERHEEMRAKLDRLAQADAWRLAAQALDTGWAAFSDSHDYVPTEQITFGLYLCDMPRTGNEDQGYSGVGAWPGYIMTVYDTPTPYNLARLQGATVHELHHNIWTAVKPPKNFMTEVTVADYMVMEGMAESFAAELYGADNIGFYVTEFDTRRLEESKARFRDVLDKTGFNLIRAYIFGDLPLRAEEANRFMGGVESVGVPPYAGYALGYHLVQAYLRRTGKTVAQATFVPVEEVVAESGYFDSGIR